MSSVVILGPHRTGTSLVASMLSAMGVDMGVVTLGSHPSQPLGHYEDLDFVRMNSGILAEHGGTWDAPPDVDWRKFRPELIVLVTMKQNPEMQEDGEARPEGQWWGFKDPRTCLTAACYHQYLDDPHYIVVHRNKSDAVASLEFREGKAGDTWEKLYDTYTAERDWFLENTDAPRLHLRYEDLVNPSTAWGAATSLALFLGLDENDALLALGNIRPATVADWRQLPSPQELFVEELTWIQGQVRHAAATFEPLNIVHLGAKDDRLRYACMEVAPGARFVNATESGAWHILNGPVHVVIATQEEDAGEWAAKVRPGGAFLSMVETCQKWHGTTWESLGRFGGVYGYERKGFMRRGQGFGTVGVGVPYYKGDYNFFRWWSHILRYGLEPDDLLLNDETVKAPFPIPLVHNSLMRRFLETDCDTFLIIEDDHCGDPDNLLDWEVVGRMREKQENHAFDIVTANYVNRRASPVVCGYGLAKKPNRNGEYICLLDYDQVQRTGTQEVDGSVFGLAFIRRWVLDAMLAGGKPADWHPCAWVGGNSQDIQFYGKARDLGARTGVDRDANIGHGAYTVMGVGDFWAARGETE